jgi:hypothetical protein
MPDEQLLLNKLEFELQYRSSWTFSLAVRAWARFATASAGVT